MRSEARGSEARRRSPEVGNGHEDCLLCGYRNPWSLGLRFEQSEDDGVRGRFRGSDELQGYQGVLHGGVLAALLDSAMVHCLFHLGIRAVTGDLHVRFVHPVACCAIVEVRAKVLSASPRLYYLRGEIHEKGRLMAWGEATFVQTVRYPRDLGRRAGL